MRMAQADRLTAFVLFVLGIAMLTGGWTMDRLEIRKIHPASIPGLVPIILGILLAICAILLWRESRSKNDHTDAPFLADGSWTRLGLTTGLCIVYALVLVGWLPFFWATALFVTAFAAVFAWPVNGDMQKRIRSLVMVSVFGLAMALSTSLLFEKLFLVRLP